MASDGAVMKAQTPANGIQITSGHNVVKTYKEVLFHIEV